MITTDSGGGVIPQENVLKVSDFILIHGSGLHEPSEIIAMVEKTKRVYGFANQPILFNEDDHFNFESEQYNFKAAIESYNSWGYFDYRLDGVILEDGYQSVPVDLGINSHRKKAFIKELKEITGFKQIISWPFSSIP